MEIIKEKKYKIITNKNNEMDLFLKIIIMKNYQLLYLVIMNFHQKYMNFNVI